MGRKAHAKEQLATEPQDWELWDIALTIWFERELKALGDAGYSQMDLRRRLPNGFTGDSGTRKFRYMTGRGGYQKTWKMQDLLMLQKAINDLGGSRHWDMSVLVANLQRIIEVERELVFKRWREYKKQFPS